MKAYRRSMHDGVVLDTRWLGVGGKSRVVDQLAEGIAGISRASQVQPWGHDVDVDGFRKAVPARRPGLRALSLLWEPTLPRASHYLFPHVLRPLRPRNCSVIVLDTIPLRFGNVLRRYLWHVVFLLSVRRAQNVLTISTYARTQIARAARIDESSIRVLHLPVDQRFVDGIAGVRTATSCGDGPPYVLYFGQFNAHKNLTRLVHGFARSRFASSGGRLRLVGGADDDVINLRRVVPPEIADRVAIDGQRSRQQLIDDVSHAAAVLFVSLDEGFGLPPVESVLAGVPTLSVDLPWSHEALPVDVTRCDPLSIDSIASGIDQVVAQDVARTLSLQNALREHRQGHTAEAMAQTIWEAIDATSNRKTR